MSVQLGVKFVFLLLLLPVAAACRRPQVVEVPVEVTRVITEVVVEEGEQVEVTRIVTEGEAMAEEATPSPLGTPTAVAAVAGIPPADQPALQQRLIIKDGRITIVAEDTAAAVEQVTQMTIDLGGYIINQRLFDDGRGYLRATMRLAVPVDRFEEAMRFLRTLGEVVDEAASGTDVTEEFVDLNARLTNLRATRDRLRSFLDQAENVSETLAVNEELKKVEEEIAVIQGRINFLRDRAAFSTIDLTLNPLIPTPTPTPTATPTPLPTAETWRPADTAQLAVVELRESAQDTADFAIYRSIVCGPWLLLALFILLPAWLIVARRLRKRSARSEAPGAGDEIPEAADEAHDVNEEGRDE